MRSKRPEPRLRVSNHTIIKLGSAASKTYALDLWTIAVILFVLWALGLTTAYTASGLIHILLVLAII
jgi:hypothetical protein